MKTFSLIFLIAFGLILSQSHLTSFAKENNNLKNEKEIKNNVSLINNEESKNKFQFRIHENKNTFMVKGVILSYSSDSIKIGSKEISIDSSVTGDDIKIVGNPTVGSYAMAQGIINDSNLFATKIVVDQRNKHDLNENEEEDLSLTPTVSPTLTATPTPTLVATTSAEIENPQNLSEDLGNIIERIQDFLNYLKDIASKI